MFYYAKIKKGNGVYLVSFPDFMHINTYGETMEEARKHAEEALNGSLESDFERGFSIPKPKKYSGKNYHKIYLRPHIEIAYQLRKLRKKKSQNQIAKKLGISYQAYQKLENPRKCNPTLKTLEKIAEAMGKRVDVVVR